MGLSANKVSHFYPTSLEGQHLLVAIYGARAGEVFKMEFRDEAAKRTMNFEVTVIGMQALDPGTSELVPAPDGAEVPGWTLQVLKMNKEFMVMEPGKYEIYLTSSAPEKLVGSTNFVAVSTAEFSPEQIAAIKSDPLSAKFVRIVLGCKECPSKLRAYAGLQKDQKSEEEGWIWYRSLGTEFACECGKTKFPLVYLREGLSGILVRSTSPLSSNLISPVKLYEASALEQACRDFREILDRNAEEEQVQQFLESHPVFWHSFAPTRLMFKKPVLTKYVSDFVILNERKELLLIEIEKPSIGLIKDDGAIRHELQHAIAQVNNWIQVFNEHRAAALDCMGLKIDDVVKVKGVVIAGRTPTDSQANRLLRSWSWDDISFQTFDDLLHQTREVLRHIANV